MTSLRKIESNRRNSILGGKTFAENRSKIYNAAPAFCIQCNIQLTQTKKHNKFCSRSCAASYNNKMVPKRAKPIIPLCSHCGELVKRPTSKFCSQTCAAGFSRKYTSEEAAQVRKVRVRETSAAYRAKVKNQTPLNADRQEIKEFYSNCPKGYEVDHIIPISKGGLHELSNLQYLTRTENRKKSNKV